MIRTQRPILLIEDSDEDFDVTAACLQLAELSNPLLRCKSGSEALDYIYRRGAFQFSPEPLFILLDLNLPGQDGQQVLAELRKTPWLATVPAIVLSTSGDPRDVRLCYQLGAAGFMVKPVDLEKFEGMIRGLAEYWTKVVLLPDHEEAAYAGASV